MAGKFSSVRQQGAAFLGGVLAILLSIGIAAAAQPCADDLLVATGQAADSCMTGTSSEDVPSDSGPSVCPCTCHLGVVILAAPSSHPTVIESTRANADFSSPVDFSSAPTPPPPRS